MEFKPINDELHPRFDWIGLAALLFGIDGPIRFLANLHLYGILLRCLLLACIVVLIGFIRHYNWKNILAALLLICTLHPVRIIFHWWMNPILYALATLICLLLLMRIIRRYKWGNSVAALLLTCTLLSGWQTLVSASEVGKCVMDDFRWTHYYYCEPTKGQYQQIESLPIGMQGYCYYCPWYKGVGRW